MSIMSDPGRPAGINSPCPVWCELPGDHDLPGAPVLAGELARREHAVILLDDDRLGYVQAVRVDDVLCPDGPTVLGDVLIEVQDLPTPMTRDRFAALVDALVRAHGRVADLWAEPARVEPGEHR